MKYEPKVEYFDMLDTGVVGADARGSTLLSRLTKSGPKHDVINELLVMICFNTSNEVASHSEWVHLLLQTWTVYLLLC